MAETHAKYIERVQDGARHTSAASVGEVAIARSNLAIADAILVLAKATDRGAAADEAFAAQSAARRQNSPSSVVAPVPTAKPQVTATPQEVMDLTPPQAALYAIIRKVDEESGYSNIFSAEAIALAKEIDKTHGKRTGVAVETQIEQAVAVERERIANAFADFFQFQNFGSWISSEGRRFEDLGNGRKVGYHLAMDVINDTAKFD